MKNQRLRELDAGDWFIWNSRLCLCIGSKTTIGYNCWNANDHVIVHLLSGQEVIKIDVEMVDVTAMADEKPHYRQVAKPNEPEIRKVIIKENLDEVDYEKHIYAFNRNGMILRLVHVCDRQQNGYFFECQNKKPSSFLSLFLSPKGAITKALSVSPFLVYEFNNEDGYSGEIEYNSWAFSQFLGDRDDPGLNILRKNIDNRRRDIAANSEVIIPLAVCKGYQPNKTDKPEGQNPPTDEDIRAQGNAMCSVCSGVIDGKFWICGRCGGYICEKCRPLVGKSEHEKQDVMSVFEVAEKEKTPIMPAGTMMAWTDDGIAERHKEIMEQLKGISDIVSSSHFMQGQIRDLMKNVMNAILNIERITSGIVSTSKKRHKEIVGLLNQIAENTKKEQKIPYEEVKCSLCKKKIGPGDSFWACSGYGVICNECHDTSPFVKYREEMMDIEQMERL